MCCILLGLVIDVQLPDNISNVCLVCSIHALLDFLYLAQYPVHTDETLELLEDALSQFHANKDIFVKLGICDGFNLPKLHFASHYVKLIKLYGTTDNFNTKYTECLHIDLTKDAYAATNFKDESMQMTTWLEQKEKILCHDQHAQWQLNGSPPPEPQEWLLPGLELDQMLSMAKHPSICAVPIDRLESMYGAQFFCTALQRFVTLSNEPHLTSAQLEHKLWDIHLPF